VYLRELYQVDPEYVLDPQQFSPKVVALALDAKKEENAVRCHNTVDDARKLLQSGNATLLVDILATMKARCPAVSEIEPQAADLVYKQGLEAYKKGDFPVALQDFRSALKLNPKHELASDYAGVVEGKLQIGADRLLLEWRKAFDAHQYRDAGAKYHEMSAIASKQTLSQADSAYREALTGLVQEWNRLCPTQNKSAMDVVRAQIDELLPDPAFGQDIRQQMTDCRSKAGCMAINSHVMMTRLKLRVNPEITRDMRNMMGQNQVVHVR